MGFLAPAIPWIIKGGATLGGILAGKKAQSSAQQRSPEELAALQGAQGAAGALGRQGQTLTRTGLPALQSSLGYWQTLLGGNRAAMSQATAAPRAAITEQYQGAERNLERSGLRGATKDLSVAELGRQRVGQIAGLTSGVQPMAAQQLMAGGQGLVGQGTQALGAAGSLWGNLLGEGAQNRQYARGEGEKAGTSIGGLIFDILSGGWKRKPAAGLPGLPGGSRGPF